MAKLLSILTATVCLSAASASALTPETGKVIDSKDIFSASLTDAPNWMSFTADAGDTLSGSCLMYIQQAGLNGSVKWTDCAGSVVEASGEESFLPEFKLREGTNYFFPVVVRDGSPILPTKDEFLDLPEKISRLEGELKKLEHLPTFAKKADARLGKVEQTMRAYGGDLSSLEKGVATANTAADNAADLADKAMKVASGLSTRVRTLEEASGGTALAIDRQDWRTWWPALLLAMVVGLAVVLWLVDARSRKNRRQVLAQTGSVREAAEQVASLKLGLNKADNRARELGGKLAAVEVQQQETAAVAAVALKLSSSLVFDHVTDLTALNRGSTSVWKGKDVRTGEIYRIPFTKNDKGLIEAPILRRANNLGCYIQPFKFGSEEQLKKRLRLAHADCRLTSCIEVNSAA